MIDLIIRLIEKLLELLKHRNQFRNKQFAESIDCVFQDLKVIHQDYLQMFTTCLGQLRVEKELSEVTNSLLLNRLEHEAMRRSVSSLADSLAQNKKLEEFEHFFIEVRNYFSSNGSFPTDTRSSILLGEIERCVREQQFGEFVSSEFSEEEIRQFLSQLVQSMLSDIRSSWLKLSNLYAKAASGNLK